MSLDPRYAPLFEPLKIGPVTAPNRFAVAPYANGHSFLMPNGARGIRETRAEGGWGIVGMQLTEIDPTSDLSGLPYERLWDDDDVAVHARSVDAIQAHGALASIELAHTGLRSRGVGTGYPVMGPSSASTLRPELPFMAKAMDRDDIRRFRQSHRDAVLRARRAGYDIAYVYAAHDASLLWHFLSPAYNRRTDEYGGSFDNRLRLLREVLEDAQDAAAGEMAIAIRFAVHELTGPKAIRFDGEGRDVVEALAELPDLWDVNISGWQRDSGTSRYDAEGFQEAFTSFVKQVTNKPVLGVGRFTSPDTMVSQLRRGVLDIIGSARASIADPFLPNKIREGRVEDIRECIGCNVCVAVENAGVVVRCTQNPTVSEEWRRGWHPERVPVVTDRGQALVIGGGPAGLEAALTLARGGHRVTLAEAGAHFGGRVHHESRLRNLAAWGRVADYRLYQLGRMESVSLFAQSTMTAETVAELAADHVLVATGARWLRSGRGRTHRTAIDGFADAALTPDDLFTGMALAPGLRVVIYDDDHDYLANALAADLAAQGLSVELVSPMPSIASWMGYTLEQPRMLAELIDAGVGLHPNTVARAWTGNGPGQGPGKGLAVQRADTGAELPVIEGDILISVGLREPDLALSEALHAAGIAHRVIGDAEAPGPIQSAVFSGHRHARDLLGQEPEGGHFRRERPRLF